MFNELNLFLLLICTLAGLFAGITAGLFGLGGGIVVVPALYYVFYTQGFSTEHLMQMATTTSLVTILFTGGVATVLHQKRRAIIWQAVLVLAPGLLLGAMGGAVFAHQLASESLRIIFGGFGLLLGLYILFSTDHIPNQPQWTRRRAIIAGLTSTPMGGIASLLGIGGGTLIVPLLLRCNVPIKKAVACSAACGLFIALGGATTMISTSFKLTTLPHHTIGYLYWPVIIPIGLATLVTTPLAVRWMHALPVNSLKRIFAIVLILTGIGMIL